MARRSLSRQVALVITSTALVFASAMGGRALAAPAVEPPSTPVPISTPDGLLMSYLVNVRDASPGRTKLAELAVRDAGGTVVQSWDQIGVIVAHSTKAAFRADVVRLAKDLVVESVGATFSIICTTRCITALEPISR
jgi:hypothetical protein